MTFKPIRKDCQFPKCGEKFTIRKLNGNDWAMTSGKIPDLSLFLTDDKPKTENVKKADIQYVAEMACRAIVKSPPGMILWAKVPDNSFPPGVVSFYDLESGDQDYLIYEVFGLAMSGGEGDNAARFPEKQGASGPGPSAG